MTWHIGDTVRLQCYFYIDSVLTDPTTITLIVEDPSGNLGTYTYAGAGVTKTGTGDYYRDTALDEEGTWHWRWAGTGTVPAADEDELEVKRSEIV